MATVQAKQGINAFGAISEKPTTAGATPSNLTPQQLQQLGGENVGEVLNKLSDANWTDPSKKMRTAGNDQLDKDAFFKLMLAQMKNQDPTNPMKSHEMAAQLANFSSLEQMQNLNSTMTEIKNAQKPQEAFQALNLIGKSVAGDSAKLTRMKGDTNHDFRFTLPADAQEFSLKVRDASGTVVKTLDAKSLKAGDNKLTWNGQDERGNATPAGEYQFFAEAKDGSGKKMEVKTSFDGMITGVNFGAEGPVLVVGNQTVKWRDVKKITDPSLLKNDQKINNVETQDLKKDNATGETQIKGNVEQAKAAPEAPVADVSSIMDSVGLSREMMEQVAKEAQGG